MTDGSVVPVVIGLSAGIALVIMFALVTNTSIPAIQKPVATELPQVKLVVLDASHEKEISYSGERGTYCWHNFGCADTGIIISNNSAILAKGSIIRFAFLDSHHNITPPDELSVIAFDLHRDLKVVGTTQGRIGGDVQIAGFNIEKQRHYLSDIGNHNYALDLAPGEYVIQVETVWHQDGDVSYFYRVSVT